MFNFEVCAYLVKIKSKIPHFEPGADLSRYRRGIGQISADFERGRFAKVSFIYQRHPTMSI